MALLEMMMDDEYKARTDSGALLLEIEELMVDH